jgi:hypothetical protein
MLATMVAVTASVAVSPAAHHPCRAPLPVGPHVPAAIVLWSSCGAFELSPSGAVVRLPRHWLARHSGGTGRRWEAHVDIRRTRAGRFVLLRRGRVIWRSRGLYPRDGGSVAFGPHEFAFGTYRHGIFLTDLRGPERLVAPGRNLYPDDFTRRGDLIVVGGRPSIALVSRSGKVVRRFAYRPRSGYVYDEQADTLHFVNPAGRLVAVRGRRVEQERSVAGIDGTLNLAPRTLVFTAAGSFTVTTRDGSIVASAHWNGRKLASDSGVAASPDGRSFAFRLSNARPGARSGSATVYLLRAGSRRARRLFRHRLGPSGCAVGASFGWHGASVLYSSTDGALAVLDTRTGTAVDLRRLAAALPHRWAAERPLAAWRSELPR